MLMAFAYIGQMLLEKIHLFICGTIISTNQSLGVAKMQDMIFDISPDKYNTLSEAERYLLKYIYEHLDDISTMSIVKLSENANVSTATIVRLMKKIGYDGYQCNCEI